MFSVTALLTPNPVFCSNCPGAARSSLLPPSYTPPALLAPSLHVEHPRFTPSSSSPHCLAYLPSLSQPSVVMLYRPGQAAEGQRSPKMECEEGRKRRWEEGGEEEMVVVKKKGSSGSEECDEVRAEFVCSYCCCSTELTMCDPTDSAVRVSSGIGDQCNV